MLKFELPPSIKEAIRHNSLILFIGSGYSRNINLPTWNDLAKRLVDELSQKDSSLEALKTEASKYGMEPNKILNSLFERGHDTDSKKILQDIIDIDLSNQDLDNQKNIWKISEKIITTNYDKALESALDEDLREKVEVLVPEDGHAHISFLRNVSYLYKIHGSIDRPETCVLFSADYDQLYKYNHVFLTELKRLTANSVILFIGYSISDIEIKQILGNINLLFHIGTKHFVVTPDEKGFKNIGVDTIKIKNYSELLPYLDELVSYRQEIVRNFSAIEERVNEKYKGTKDLLSSFEKKNQLYAEKEAFKRQEDRKDILQLQLLNAADPVANESIINSLKAKGKEEQLKDYLLVRREASRLDTRAYFEHVETGRGQSYYEAWVKTNLEAMEIARQIFGEKSEETINLYNDIGRGYMYLNDFENAENYFKEGLQLALETGEYKYLTGNFYTNLGNVETENKNLDKAMNYYQLALHIRQENGEETEGEMQNIARTLLEQKKYEDAKKIYKQILQNTHAPILQKADTYMALGLTHVRLDEHGDAIKCYEQALSLFFEYYGKENKEFIIFYNDIGYSLTQEKRYENAIAYYKKVIALEQNTENIFIAMNNMGEAYYKAEQFEEAKAVFEKSLVFLKQKGPSESEYPRAYEYCRQQIKLCREKMEQR